MSDAQESSELAPVERLKQLGPILLPQSRCAAWLFARMLGIIYIIAFASLYVQIDGLIGSQGISPAAHFLEQVEAWQPDAHQRLLPTLAWISASDGFLHGLCLVGMLAGLCVACGFSAWWFLLVCWACYLSLTQVGQSFFSFQWDVLLLEVSICALFLIPVTSLRARGPKHTRYHRIGLCILYLLLFKLMFSSGMVKIVSGDPTWANLSAMEYHYETQPLPLASAWFTHKLPADLLKASTFAMFIIELVFPFCIFLPRLFRLVGTGGLILLQLLIMATGNYCFFNLLTLALCLLLVDDKTWCRIRWVRKHFDGAREYTPSDRLQKVRRVVCWPLAAIITLLMIAQTGTTATQKSWFFPPLQWVKKSVDPYRSFNGYGLFAVMTTKRPEIIFQGSYDGVEWKDYEFKYKPGDLSQRPRMVAPHQPRLDWQLWFAALAYDYPQPHESQPWMLPFVERMLEGQPEVLKLMDSNPFPDKPPKYIRAMTYDYTFTSRDEKKASGNWWKREALKPYFPSISLRR